MKKKSTLFAILVVIASNTMAQQFTNSGTNDISNTNTGNVGIGTTNPLEKLHVIGNIGLGEPTNNQTLNNFTISNLGTTGGNLTISAASQSIVNLKGGNVIIKGGDGFSVSAGITGVYNGAKGGNIVLKPGIGGTDIDDGIIILDGQIVANQGATFNQIVNFNESVSFNKVIGAPNFIFYERTSNIGVGAMLRNKYSSNTSILEICDKAGNRLQAFEGKNFNSQFINLESGGFIKFGGSSSGEYITSERGAGLSQFNLSFHTQNGKKRMEILNNGNVLIGTKVPTATDWKLAVDGTIYSQKSVVTALSNWADYVFEPNYKLTSLNKVEAFVNKNHHLPAIPSAAEIKEKGIDTGEMLKLQMEKIEELYLHMIAQQKEIAQLKAQLNK